MLEPILAKTASLPGVSPGDVRIVWVVSLIQRLNIEDMEFDKDGVPLYREGFMHNYIQSKMGSTWLADHFAKRLNKNGVLSVVSCNANSIFEARADIEIVESSSRSYAHRTTENSSFRIGVAYGTLNALF